MEPRDDNGQIEQIQSREFLCHSIQTRCTLEKFYLSRGNGIRQNVKATRNENGLCGTSTQETGIYTIFSDQQQVI